jgi:hypothetical protein
LPRHSWRQASASARSGSGAASMRAS